MFRKPKRSCWRLLVTAVWLTATVAAAAKAHVITIGKAMPVQWFAGADQNNAVIMKVRPLFVDGHVKEYVVGPSHDITDRQFAARRAFRVNDSLPEDSRASRWRWQRGGWLLVDRVTGHISPINLPKFDAYYSAASWYRDYVSYCGVSEDGHKVYAMVVQLGRRKPVLKQILAGKGVSDDAAPDSACQPPIWRRAPTRITFEPAGGTAQTFVIRGHGVDSASETEEKASK